MICLRIGDKFYQRDWSKLGRSQLLTLMSSAKFGKKQLTAAGGKVPSGRVVKGIFERLKKKPVLQQKRKYLL